MGSKVIHCNLHKQLVQFSVFADKNPLKVAVGVIKYNVCFVSRMYQT